MRKTTTYRLVQGAMIAALYAALTLVLAPLSFGQVQIRFAEALTILAVFSLTNVYGLALGCLIANGVGLLLGANLLGALDMLFGTLATLLAALISYALRKVRIGRLPVLSALAPVIFNGVIIGGELSVLLTNSLAPVPFFTNAAFVAAGEIIPCMVLGLILLYTLEKTGLDKKLF